MIVPSQDSYPVLLVGIFVLGAAGGGLSNLTSGGAGAVTIYLLTKLLGLEIQESTGTVLAASAVIVFLGAVSFYKRKQVETRLALTVGISGVAGAFLSAVWVSSLTASQTSTLEHAFGAFTLCLTAYFAYSLVSGLRPRRGVSLGHAPHGEDASAGIPGASGPVSAGSSTAALRLSAGDGLRWAGSNPAAVGAQIAKGLLIGIATGLFGIGLASISVVAFIVLFKVDTKMALGTSLFASFLRYSGGAVGYVISGQIDPFIFAILVAGGTLGSILGIRLIFGSSVNHKMGESGDALVKALQVVILIFVGCSFLVG